MYAPVVDFSLCGVQVGEVEPTALKDTGEALYNAFKTAGFAYLSNHGIDMELVDEVNNAAQEFFDKDVKYKEKWCSGDITFGYDKMGKTRANPHRPHDYHEGFCITSNSLTDKPLKWPEMPGFEKSVKEIALVCRRLTTRVLQALGEGMDLKEPGILARSHNLLNQAGNHTALRIISYPGIESPESLAPNQLRVGEHCDWGTITLLFQDQIGGLQMKSLDGTFVDLPPKAGTIVVNVGEMLAIWSRHRLRSTNHRVTIPDDSFLRSKTRRSIVYFVNPDDSTVLSKLEYKKMEKQPPSETTLSIKENTTVHDYLEMKFEQFYDIHASD